MSDSGNHGRFYLRVRHATPKLLGMRACPNCRREKPLEKFKKVRRAGGRTGWLCETCFEQRESQLRSVPK